VVMARGRDAADTALTTSFAHTLLEEFIVWTDRALPTEACTTAAGA